MDTELDKIEAEKRELDLLLNKGMSFDLEVSTYKRGKGLGYLRKERVIEKQTFIIKEPTLSTLDRLAVEQIDMNFNESILESTEGVAEAKRLIKAHAKRCARIIAIAVVGSGTTIEKAKTPVLSELFYENIKPSKLFAIARMINAISNLGDFCNSIRYMSASRTTMPEPKAMPDRIEETAKD